MGRWGKYTACVSELETFFFLVSFSLFPPFPPQPLFFSPVFFTLFPFSLSPSLPYQGGKMGFLYAVGSFGDLWDGPGGGKGKGKGKGEIGGEDSIVFPG